MAIKGDIINGPLIFYVSFSGKIRVIVLVLKQDLKVMKKINANLKKHYSGT